MWCYVHIGECTEIRMCIDNTRMCQLIKFELAEMFARLTIPATATRFSQGLLGPEPCLTPTQRHGHLFSEKILETRAATRCSGGTRGQTLTTRRGGTERTRCNGGNVNPHVPLAIVGAALANAIHTLPALHSHLCFNRLVQQRRRSSQLG